MRKLTRRQALERCREMWQWLAENPTRDKRSFIPKEVYRPFMDCYCCEYVDQRVANFNCSCSVAFLGNPGAKENLRLCPLQRLWPKGCMHPNAAYKRWCAAHNDSIARIEMALAIVNACTLELSKQSARVRKTVTPTSKEQKPATGSVARSELLAKSK